MREEKREKKLSLSFMTNYLLVICLYFVQVGGGILAQTENGVLPEKQLEDNTKVNNQNSQDNLKHEQEALQNGGLATKCVTKNEEIAAKYQDMLDFEDTFQKQNLNKIQDAQRVLGQYDQTLGSKEGVIDDEAGQQINAADGTTLDAYMKEQKALWDQWAAKRKALESELPGLKQEVESLESQCYDRGGSNYCPQSVRDKLAAARASYTSKSNEYVSARTNEKKYEKQYKYAGKKVQNQQGNIGAAENDMLKNDALAEKSHDVSGCNQRGGAPTRAALGSSNKSEDCELTGPLYDAYENLNSLVNASTESAARMARIQTEKANDLALKNQNPSDYRLYELALDEFDESNSTLKYADDSKTGGASKFHGHKMALSNIEVMAYVGAATKNMRCKPLEKSSDGADSKAYHLFRAASATFLMAQMNDTAFYSDNTSCRAYENYTEDDKDTQFRTVERAANLKQEVFEQLCLKVDPSSEAARKECNEYISKAIGEEYVDKPKTRDQALIMFKAALKAAQEEVNLKNKRITTAYKNVQKGKKWVKKTTNQIKQTIALKVMAWSLYLLYKALSSSCCAATPVCGACPALVKMMLNWLKSWKFFVALLAYYFIDLARAKKFLAKWEDKWEKAQLYTHLDCKDSYNMALAERDGIDRTIEKSREEVEEQIKLEKQKVLDKIQKNKDSPVGDDAKTTLNLKNYDRKVALALLDNISQERETNHSIIQTMELTRYLNGENISLPYFAKAKDINSVQKDLSVYGIKIGKLVKDSAIKALTLMVGTAHAASNDSQGEFKADINPAVGIKSGSTSFAHFLAKRNRAWLDLTFDASDKKYYNLDKHKSASGILNLYSPKMPADKNTGFPVPETRVTTIQLVTNIVEQNINGLYDAIAEAMKQRDIYVTLLNDMRERMSLKRQGTDHAQVETVDISKAGCMKDQGGKVEVDPKCDCKVNDSCAKFQYPTIKVFKPETSQSTRTLVEKDAREGSRGKPLNSSFTSGELSKLATGLKQELDDAKAENEKIRKENGFGPDQTSKAADELLASSRSDAFGKFLEMSPELAAREYFEGEMSDYSDKASDLNGKDGKSGKDGLANGKNGRNGKGGKFDRNALAASKFDLAAYKKSLKKKWSLDFSKYNTSEGQDNFTAEQLALMERERLAAAAKNSASGDDQDSNSRQYGHIRKSYGDNGNGLGSGINMNRNSDIFKIISKRYERTAYPIFSID